jgi:hypothetical protein
LRALAERAQSFRVSARRRTATPRSRRRAAAPALQRGLDMDDSRWSAVAKLGGWAAISMLALIPLQIVAYVVSPPPTSVIGWYELFADNRLLALVDLDLLLLVDYLLAGAVFVALWVSMRRSHPAAMAIMLGLELLAIAAYIASNPAIEMMSLADQYAAATTDARRGQLVAAGESTLAAWTGTAFVTSYLLSAAATLVASIAMLRSGVFSRATAVLGIVYGALNVVPSNAGTLGLVLSLASLIPMVAWLALIAHRLLRAPSPVRVVVTTPSLAFEGRS